MNIIEDVSVYSGYALVGYDHFEKIIFAYLESLDYKVIRDQNIDLTAQIVEVRLLERKKVQIWDIDFKDIAKWIADNIRDLDEKFGLLRCVHNGYEYDGSEIKIKMWQPDYRTSYPTYLTWYIFIPQRKVEQ